MCGRYGFTIHDEKEILNRFDIEMEMAELGIRSNYNVAPTQEMPVVERHSPNGLYVRKWGIQPAWSKMLLINAKSENVDSSKVWARAFRESRCIVPANYFFEWKKLEDGKQPYLIQLRSKEMFGFAGLSIPYRSPKGEEGIGFIIITTEPNELMRGIHNRMPVILKRDDEEDWLNPDNSEPEYLKQFLKPYDADEMEAYPVSREVNSPSNNYPEVTKQV